MIRPILILCLPYIVGCTSPTVADSPGVDDTHSEPSTHDTQDTDDSGGGSKITGCPSASQLEGAETLEMTHMEWGEAAWALMEGEAASGKRMQVSFDSLSEWEIWIAETGLFNPIPEVDLDTHDLLLVYQVDGGCMSAIWTFDEAYVHADSRVVVGTYDRPPEDPDTQCDAMWVDVHLLIVEEAEPDLELCLDEVEYGGPRGG